jgi:hypothetical protein
MRIKSNKTVWIFSILVLLFTNGEFLFGLDGLNRAESNGNSPYDSNAFLRSALISSEDASSSDQMKPPSKAKAFFLSFLIPGAGEYYVGSKKMAKVFLGTEILLWSTYLSFRVYGNWKRHDYELFAMTHAGVHATGKDHAYYVAMEDYNSLHEYNEAKLRQRNLSDLYPEDQEHYWRWDSSNSRKKFTTLRISSDLAFNRSLFVIGGILLNHLISGIDAMRLARKEDQLHQKQMQIGVAGLPEGGFVVSLWKTF